MLRRVAVVAAALIAFLAGPAGLGRALAAQDLAAMTNADRAANGLRPLVTAGDLQSLAQQRANDMARTGVLAHTTNLGSKVSGWQKVGENVGRGPTLGDIETAFMNSPEHRQNILDPAFTQFGVGVTYDGSRFFYVAVIFRQPMGSVAPPPAPAPVPRSASTPKPAPKPAPRPAPTTTTRPPTTTTTQPPTTTTVPPAPPVEVTAPVEAPVETTTTTAPRPIYDNPDFLAANFGDRVQPAMVPAAAHRTPMSLPLMAGFSALAVTGGASTALRRHGRPSRRPDGRWRRPGRRR